MWKRTSVFVQKDLSMAQPQIQESEMLAMSPDISHIETENDDPVDNIFSEKQQRLLTRSLYAS